MFASATLKSFSIFLLLSVSALYFIYAPVLHIPFYHHDIYKFSVGGWHKTCAQDYGYENMYIQVRPIVAWLDCLNFKLGETLTKMRYLRVSCVLFMSLFASLLSWWLLQIGFSWVIAFIVSVLLFSLPGMQTVMIMGINALILAPFMAFCGYLLLQKGWQRKQYGWIAISMLTLLLAFFTYPAGASFFLVPTMVFTLFNPFNDWLRTRRVVVRDISFFLMTCLLFFVAAKIIQTHLISTDYPAGYAFNPNWNVVARIHSLLQVFPSFWLLTEPTYVQSAFTYVLLLAAACIAIKPDISYQFVAEALLTVVVLLLLSSLGYLLQPGNMIFTRILYVFQVMSVLLIIWALRALFFQHRQYLLTAGVLLLMLGGYIANSNVTHSALNDYTELSLITARLENALKQQPLLRRIHMVGPPIETKLNFNGLSARDDIFNINSSSYRQDAYYMINAAFKQFAKPGGYHLYNCGLDEFQLKHISEADCIEEAPLNSIIVTYSRGTESISATEPMVIINMAAQGEYLPIHPKNAFEG